MPPPSTALRPDQPVAAAVLPLRRLPRGRRLQRTRTARDKGVLANRLNLEWDLWLTSTERFHMFTGPFQDGNDFHARRVRRRRRRVLRRARLLRRRHRHAVLRRRPRLHDRRLDRPVRAVRHAGHRRPDPAVVPERRVDGGRDRRRRRHDSGPQQPHGSTGRTTTSRSSPASTRSPAPRSTTATRRPTSSAPPRSSKPRAATSKSATPFSTTRPTFGRSYNNVGVSYTRRYLNLVSNSMRADRQRRPGRPHRRPHGRRRAR